MGVDRSLPQSQAALAVPNSVGPLRLPPKPPAPHGGDRNSKKHKKQHNQLGLTPRAEEYESIEEPEEDENEEVLLEANVASGPSQLGQLQICYKGRTSVLRSAADIAAWIEERKKRFPTKAKRAQVAEHRRQQEEAQIAAKYAQTKVRHKHVAEARERQLSKISEKEGKLTKDMGCLRERQERQGGTQDAAVGARCRVDRYYEQLEHDEKRIGEARAGVTLPDNGINAKDNHPDCPKPQHAGGEESCSPGCHLSSRLLANGNEKPVAIQDQEHPAMTLPDLVASLSQRLDPMEAQNFPRDHDTIRDPKDGLTGLYNTKDDQTTTTSDSFSSSMSSVISFTTSEDVTSSSGTDSSTSDEAGPEETSSKRGRPEKSLPPKRQRSQKVCKFFFEKGRCRREASCTFKHELPGRSRNATAGHEMKAAEEASQWGRRTERLSLYQRLVRQEKMNVEEAARKPLCL